MKFFVNEELIPNDGSREVLKNLQKDIAGQGIEIKVFPDIHYKKGSDVTNGLLTEATIKY